MNKLLTSLTLLMALSSTVMAADSDNCDYRNDGGYNSRDCHVLNEERLDALESQVSGITVIHGTDGVDGANGTNGINGQDGADGRDGIDGSNFDASSIISEYSSGISQSAAMSQIAQAPHDQSSISLGCASFLGASECVIGGSLYLEDSNILLNVSIGSAITAGGITYHFGH